MRLVLLTGVDSRTCDGVGCDVQHREMKVFSILDLLVLVGVPGKKSWLLRSTLPWKNSMRM